MDTQAPHGAIFLKVDRKTRNSRPLMQGMVMLVPLLAALATFRASVVRS
jgi:hypothetical protein